MLISLKLSFFLLLMNVGKEKHVSCSHEKGLYASYEQMHYEIGLLVCMYVGLCMYMYVCTYVVCMYVGR